MNMYNYFLKARVSLRTLSSLVINLFTQVAIVLELALVSSHLSEQYISCFAIISIEVGVQPVLMMVWGRTFVNT